MASAMIAVATASSRPYPDISIDDFREENFDQLIDHMNYQDSRTYK